MCIAGRCLFAMDGDLAQLPPPTADPADSDARLSRYWPNMVRAKELRSQFRCTDVTLLELQAWVRSARPSAAMLQTSLLASGAGGCGVA